MRMLIAKFMLPSYEEGREVLYADNSMFIDGGPLLDVLLQQQESPQQTLIPPADLHLVTCIETRWRFEIFSLDPAAQLEARNSTAEYIRLLPRAFPALTKLYISFADPVYSRNIPPSEVADEIRDALLEPLSRVLVQTTRLADYTVALPSNLFGALSAQNVAAGGQIVKGKAVVDRKFWQPCLSRSGLDSDQGPPQGYWIAAGEESNLNFDATGKPFLMSHRAAVLH